MQQLLNTLLSHLPNDLTVVTLILVAARTAGVVALLPGGESLKVLPRLVLIVAFTTFVFFSDPSHFQNQYSANLQLKYSSQLLVQFIVQFLFGAALVLPLRVVVDGAEMCGEFIDTARGQMVSAVQDPLHSQSSSDLGAISQFSTTVLILISGGLEGLLYELSRSFSKLPVSSAIEIDSVLSHLPKIGETLTHFLLLALVWIVPIVAVDIATAMAGRLFAGTSFVTLSYSIKTALTFLIIAVVVSMQAEPLPYLLSYKGW